MNKWSLVFLCIALGAQCSTSIAAQQRAARSLQLFLQKTIIFLRFIVGYSKLCAWLTLLLLHTNSRSRKFSYVKGHFVSIIVQASQGVHEWCFLVDACIRKNIETQGHTWPPVQRKKVCTQFMTSANIIFLCIILYNTKQGIAKQVVGQISVIERYSPSYLTLSQTMTIIFPIMNIHYSGRWF